MGKMKVKYEIGKVSRPPKFLRNKHYGLLCFKDYERALIFSISSNIILKCYCKSVRKVLPSRLDYFNLYRGKIRKVESFWPDETLMTPWIKPLEVMEVKNDSI